MIATVTCVIFYTAFFLSIRDISSYESIFIALESNKKNV